MASPWSQDPSLTAPTQCLMPRKWCICLVRRTSAGLFIALITYNQPVGRREVADCARGTGAGEGKKGIGRPERYGPLSLPLRARGGRADFPRRVLRAHYLVISAPRAQSDTTRRAHFQGGGKMRLIGGLFAFFVWRLCGKGRMFAIWEGEEGKGKGDRDGYWRLFFKVYRVRHRPKQSGRYTPPLAAPRPPYTSHWLACQDAPTLMTHSYHRVA